MLATTALAFLYWFATGHSANTALIYVMALVLVARYTTGYLPGILASLTGVICVNYFFTYPAFMLNFTLSGYPVTFLAMLVISVAVTTATSHMKEQARDLSRHEKLLAEAEKEKMKANLLRAVSHDLRTPLTTISGNASNLLSNGDSFDALTKKQIYTDIYDDSMWLINLVENLLYATRIEEGRMTLHTSTELLSDIVEEAMNPIRRKAGSRRIFAVHEDDLLFVQADAKLIVQVIVNLVDNAAKYTPPDTAVTITAERNGGMAEIRIADNGNGIPDEEKPKIFEKFYCGRNKIADNRRSLGLGLYLCKAITEAHGGTISVTDNQPQGSIFCFTLPIKEITPQGGAIHE